MQLFYGELDRIDREGHICNHNYGIIVKSPTATENGTATYTCVSCGDTYTETLTPIDFTITSSNRDKVGYTGGDNEHLDIPAVFQDGGQWYRVVGIAESAFWDCRLLSSVIIPDSAQSIGDSAFRGCIRLTYVDLGNGVTSIDNCAFHCCEKLSRIAGGSNLTSIGSSAFGYCERLGSITLHNGVTSIGDRAFLWCSSLTSIIIPKSVTSIGASAFEECTSLNSFVFDGTEAEWEAVTKGENWNYNCSFTVTFISQGLAYELNEAGTAYKVTGIGTCTDTDIVIPAVYEGKPVTSIGDKAFSSCKKLTSVIIPDSVTSVGYLAFGFCEGLTSVIIPDSVTSIGDYAFDFCEALTSITIPNSVTSIGNYVFNGCEGLTGITIPNSVTSIGTCAFRVCTGLTSITIPNSVTSIGEAAFYRCEGLTSITIPKSVTSIGDRAFRGCTGLASIIVDANNSVYHSAGNCIIETAAKKLIAGCKNSVIPADGSVTNIGNSAFRDCEGLTSITIPSSVTSIGESAFWGCTGLTSIMIPDSVTSIGEYVFRGCIGLESIIVDENNSVYHSEGNCLIETETKTLIAGCKNSVIPDDGSVTRIESSAFRGCEGLTSITIPSSVSSIGNWVFEGCTELESIIVDENNSVYHSEGNCLIATATKKLIAGCKNSVIPDDGSVTSIGNYAFQDCTELTSITIPSSVTSVGIQAFQNCTGLTSVTFTGSPDEWEAVTKGENWKYGCSFTVTVTGKNPSKGLEFSLNSDGESYTVSGIGTCTDTEIVIPSTHEGKSVTAIGNSAFNGCAELKSIEIPNSVTSIGRYAFYCCYGLTSITIPNSVISIGDRAFGICTCTATGLTEGQHCSVCNEVIVAQESIPELGHNYNYEGVKYELVPGTNMERATCANGCTTYDYRIAQSEGEGDGGNTDNTVVVIPEKPAEKPNTITSAFDKELIKHIVNDTTDFVLNVVSDIIDLVFDNKSLETISRLFTEENKSVSIAVDDKTADVEGATTVDKLYFDIYLSKNDQKVEHHEFGNGFVTVTIPLDRLGDLTGKNVKVYYVERNEDGTEKSRTEMTEGFNFDSEKNEVTFKTNHFSEYEVEATNAHVHTYGVPVWSWTEDNSSATATFTCTGEGECNEQTKTVPATIVTESDTETETIYKATVQHGEQTYDDTKTVKKTPAVETVEVIVDNKTGTTNSATVVAPVGIIGQEYTITVTCNVACVVLAKTGDDTYTRLTATPVDGETNTYTFKTTLTADMTFIVAIKGDVTLDGEVNSEDESKITRALLYPSHRRYKELTKIEFALADNNNDKLLNSEDESLITRALLYTSHRRYKAFEW